MTDNSGLLSQDLAGISETRVRHGFIQKVYGILGTQLLLTGAIGAAIYTKAPLLSTSTQLALLYASMVASISILCVFMCCPDTMRKTPINYALLLLFTVAESVLVGFVSAQYTVASVLMAFGITTIVVLSLSIFACQTKIDFTGCGPYLFVALMCLMAFGFMLWMCSLFTSFNLEIGRTIYALIGSLIFSMYIVYDTQLIVGGKHRRHQFSTDDYCMAAINLYIDIIQLFLYILQLFGDRR